MLSLYDSIPTWEDFIISVKNEDIICYFYTPDLDQNINEYWLLHNEFKYNKKLKKNIDNWVFTLYWEDETGKYFDKGESFNTLEEALEAKIFDGESIHDLYKRKYEFL